MSTFNPIAASSRIKVADALRGFALLGIILANVPFAFNFETLYAERSWMVGNPEMDSFLHLLCQLFIDKKFVAIFSILFGFGFHIQLNRAKEKGIDFQPYFVKRMLLLLLLACIHAYLIWFGDILRDYAICGMLLLLFRNCSDNKLLRTGIGFSVFGTGLIFILNGVFEMNTSYPYDPAIVGELGYASSYWRYLSINFTIDPFVNFIHDSPLTLCFALGGMLLGFWLGRIGFFSHPEKHNRLMNRWIGIGIVGGILGSVGFWMLANGKLTLDLPIIWVVFVIVAGMLSQSLAYIFLFVKGFSHKHLRPILGLFIPIGRMALTNYVLQSIFFTLVFFHWFPGLDLYGKTSLTETYLIALGLFAFQVIGSHYWLTHFSQGPLEFLWKKWTY